MAEVDLITCEKKTPEQKATNDQDINFATKGNTPDAQMMMIGEGNVEINNELDEPISSIVNVPQEENLVAEMEVVNE